MGCDIHSFAVDAKGVPIDGVWADGKTHNPDNEWRSGEGEPFGFPNYGVFGFLAGVRNCSGVTPISEPRGLPDDVASALDDDMFNGEWIGDHSHSWLSVEELLAFDYDAKMEDRRTSGRLASGVISGAITAPQGEGQMMTWREFLGPGFFKDIEELQRIGADRVVFGFDS